MGGRSSTHAAAYSVPRFEYRHMETGFYELGSASEAGYTCAYHAHAWLLAVHVIYLLKLHITKHNIKLSSSQYWDGSFIHFMCTDGGGCALTRTPPHSRRHCGMKLCITTKLTYESVNSRRSLLNTDFHRIFLPLSTTPTRSCDFQVFMLVLLAFISYSLRFEANLNSS